MRFWLVIGLAFICGFQTSVLPLHFAIHKSPAMNQTAGLAPSENSCELCAIAGTTAFLNFEVRRWEDPLAAAAEFTLPQAVVMGCFFCALARARGPPRT